MYRQIYELLNHQGKVKTAVVLDGPHTGCRCMIWQDQCVSSGDPSFDWSPYLPAVMESSGTERLVIGGTTLLTEVYQKNPRLVLLGGGHVSCPTARIAKMVGFSITVMDDRPEFVTPERFPDAEELICGTFDELSQKIPAYENAYYVVITRGHKGDSSCARQILNRPYTYFGMIGSRTKVRLTREKLLSEGFTPKQLDTIHSPIGLPIGGQTPEEIAVSILAEIIQVKNRLGSVYMDESIEDAVMSGMPGTMITITNKRGSSPRGIGSKLFLSDEGTLFGTIGGGSVEYEALNHAGEVDHPEIRTYHLSVSDQKNSGMICGGEVEVLFEKIR